jgi:hypothetical protein
MGIEAGAAAKKNDAISKTREGINRRLATEEAFYLRELLNLRSIPNFGSGGSDKKEEARLQSLVNRSSEGRRAVVAQFDKENPLDPAGWTERAKQAREAALKIAEAKAPVITDSEARIANLGAEQSAADRTYRTNVEGAAVEAGTEAMRNGSANPRAIEKAVIQENGSANVMKELGAILSKNGVATTEAIRDIVRQQAQLATELNTLQRRLRNDPFR